MHQTPHAATSIRPSAWRRSVHTPTFPDSRALILDRPGDGEDDDQNTDQTVSWMLALIKADAKSPIVQKATMRALSSGDRDAAASIFRYIRQTVRFQSDAVTATLAGLARPQETEVLMRPADLLAMPDPAGDCDDFVMLAAAMLTAARIPVRVVAIEQDPDMPGLFSHVYAEAYLDGTWEAFDASHGQHIGWFVPPVPKGKIRRWNIPAGDPMNRRIQYAQIGQIDWTAIARDGIKATSNILTTRFAANAQNPGFVQGQIQFPDASASLNTGISGNMMLVGAVVLVGVVALIAAKKS